MSFRYLLVDDYWTHVGWFESEIPDWSVGQELVTALGQRFAISAIVPNPDPGSDFVATWTVEPA